MRRALATAAVVCAVTGCAAMPTSGGVNLGRAVPGVGVDNAAIRAFPSGPLPGASPTRLVTEYLDALVDADDNHGVARSFVAPGTSWNPAAGTTIYDESSLVVRRAGPRLVQVGLRQIGTVDPRGAYRVAPTAVTLDFRVTRRAGEWRLSRLPAGVLLSTSDAERSLQRVDLYYFNAAQTQLTPMPLLVQTGQPGLATTLARALLVGPEARLRPAVVSAVPAGVGLIGNVPIDSHGVAEVNLSGSLQQVAPAQLQRLAAQFAWTLRQVPTVTAVRLLGDGTPLDIGGSAEEQPITSFRQYAPASLASGLALYVRGSRVHAFAGLPPAGLRVRGLTAAAVSPDGARAAALRRRHGVTRLVVGSAAGPLHAVASGAAFSAPVVAPSGEVFVVRRDPRPRLSAVAPGGQVTTVRLPRRLRRAGIQELAVSPAGSRIAVVAGPAGARKLLVGVLDTSRGRPAVSGLSTVVPATRDVRGVAWSGPGELVATGLRDSGVRGVIRSPVDGYRPRFVSGAGLPAAPTQVAAAPGRPVIATAAGALWMLQDGGWARRSTGHDPSYGG